VAIPLIMLSLLALRGYRLTEEEVQADERR